MLPLYSDESFTWEEESWGPARAVQVNSLSACSYIDTFLSVDTRHFSECQTSYSPTIIYENCHRNSPAPVFFLLWVWLQVCCYSLLSLLLLSLFSRMPPCLLKGIRQCATMSTPFVSISVMKLPNSCLRPPAVIFAGNDSKTTGKQETGLDE